MKNAIIVGSSSGIGKALACVLSREGYTLGLAARRTHLLEELKNNLPGPAATSQIDVSDPAAAMQALDDLTREMGKIDLIVISAGTGFINPALDWEKEKETIDVNARGFAAMVNFAIHHFERTGKGHLVGISSIAALRGGRDAPAYNASKAFVSNYLEGVRNRAKKSGTDITVTDVQPGFVDTRMAQGEGLFWVASPEKAAEQIYRAIQRKSKHAYVTRRWRLIAWLLKSLPDFIYSRL